MSMFDNLVLDEFTMLDEGKQAEEYKARKDKEEHDDAMKNHKYRHTWDGHYDVGMGYKTKGETKSHDDYMKQRFRGRDTSTDQEKENGKRLHDSYKKADQAVSDREANYSRAKVKNDKYAGHRFRSDNSYSYNDERDKDVARAADAINRHERRHGKKSAKTESALMLIAGYEPEFAY